MALKQHNEIDTAIDLGALQGYKNRWLESAVDSEFLDLAKRLVQRTGELVNEQYRYPWDRWPIWRLHLLQDDVTIMLTLFYREGAYQPKLLDYLIKHTLHIHVTNRLGLHQVCHYCFVSPRGATKPQKDKNLEFFVPGKWQKILEAQFDRLCKLEDQKAEEQNEEIRQELLAKLLIGKDI